MTAEHNKPPGLRPRENAPLWQLSAMGVIVVILAAIAASSLICAWQLPLPPCGLKRLAGLACPFCGGTRALAALAALDIARAVLFNPLVVAGVAAVLLAALFILVGVLPANFIQQRLPKLLSGKWARWSVALVLINWLFLLWAGR